MDLKTAPEGPVTIATFEDGRPAGAHARYGQGLVFAYGFLPGLACSPFKPGQVTLDEVWPEDPRLAIGYPLVLHAEAFGASWPVHRLSEPVVEASLLTAPKGSVIVLVNHTYGPFHKYCNTAIDGQ